MSVSASARHALPIGTRETLCARGRMTVKRGDPRCQAPCSSSWAESLLLCRLHGTGQRVSKNPSSAGVVDRPTHSLDRRRRVERLDATQFRRNTPRSRPISGAQTADCGPRFTGAHRRTSGTCSPAPSRISSSSGAWTQAASHCPLRSPSTSRVVGDRVVGTYRVADVVASGRKLRPAQVVSVGSAARVAQPHRLLWCTLCGYGERPIRVG